MHRKLKLLKQAILFIKEGALNKFHGKDKYGLSPKKANQNIHISKTAIIENGANLFADETEINSCKIVIKDNVWIAKNAQLMVWKNNNLVIKDYTTIQENCQIYGDITIEKYCIFSLNCYLSSGTHYTNFKPEILIREQDSLVLSSEQGKKEHNKPIHVEEDCFIGYGTFIKPGIKIGRGAVLGAYSVILNDVEPYSVMAGQPAKKVKERLRFFPPSNLLASIDEHLPYFYRGFMHKKNDLDESRKSNLIYAESEVQLVLHKSENDKFFSIQGEIIDNIINEISIDIEINNTHKFQFEISTKIFLIESIFDNNNQGNQESDYFDKFNRIKIKLNSSPKIKWGISSVTISHT